MKILLAHNHYLIQGGEDTVFTEEREMLASHGHTVIDYEESNQQVVAMGKCNAVTRAFWSKDSYRELQRLARQKEIEVAHFHNTFLSISPAAYWACKDLGVPVVKTLHNFRLLCPNALFFRDQKVCEDCLGCFYPWPGVLHRCYRDSLADSALAASVVWFHKIIRTWARKIDIFIALTEFSKKKFVQGGIPADQIQVKPNFLYPDPGGRKGGGEFALFVGVLHQHKGVRTLLAAFQRLPGIPLKIIGDGPAFGQMQRLIADKGLRHIELLGRKSHDQTINLMKQARLLVFPSELYEGFPMTLVEAMACGLPMVVSKLGAMEGIVAHDRTGLHFEAGNREHLAEAVEIVWQNPRLSEIMGKEARQEFLQKYTAEKNHEMLLAIYELAKSRS
jgi:glycosyltransferase involved in cell wall biosynthesis